MAQNGSKNRIFFQLAAFSMLAGIFVACNQRETKSSSANSNNNSAAPVVSRRRPIAPFNPVVVRDLQRGLVKDHDCDNCAGTLNYPAADKYATLLFEDNFPKQGDADFNDAVFLFRVNERFNSKEQMDRITIEIIPVARGAEYDHQLLLVLGGKKQTPSNISEETPEAFHGKADIKVILKDQDGKVVEEKKDLAKNQDIVVFSSTKELFDSSRSLVNTEADQPRLHAKRTAVVEIDLKDPEKNKRSKRKGVGMHLYRFVLNVKDTKSDVEPMETNRSHIGDNGLPYGFIVPAAFRYPLEGIDIRKLYPNFGEYITYLQNSAHDRHNHSMPANARDWYKKPDDKLKSKVIDSGEFAPNK